MDPWRDYPNFTDGALDAFIKRFPSHPDHAAAVTEFERRRKDREQTREAKNNQPNAAALLLGKGIPAWARVAIIVVSIVFVVAALYLALQIFSLGT
jgi:ferric-dicitrate binding protein FerR (iron transport regulator)